MHFTSKLNQQVALSVLLLTLLTSLMPQLATAQPSPSEEGCLSEEPCPSKEPLDRDLLALDTLPAGLNVVTANTISQTGITVPSLWWAKEQFDEFGGKLLNNWIAYPNPDNPDQQRVDLVVNRQLWTLLDYMERYRFVNKFGTVARDYEYDVRVFNQQAERLATYTCDYSQSPPNCRIIIEWLGQEGFSLPRQ